LMTDIVTLDFETYYDKDYSLSKITTEQYIRHRDFEVIGVAAKINDGPTEWFSGPAMQTKKFLEQFDIPNSYLLAHNMAFDGAILAWKFCLKPRYYLDTLSMARPITGLTIGGSLAALAKKFCLGEKGTEVVNALGKRRADFTAEDLARYGEYCKNDVEITYTLYQILRQFSTPKEQYIIDLMIRMYTDPVLKLDRDLLLEHLQNVQVKKEKLMAMIDAAIGRDELMSNDKFAEVLRKLGVEPPVKVSLRTNKLAYAFSKTDQEFKDLLEHDDPRVQAVVSARLGVKSTLEETRTESFIGIADRGPLPIMLNYYGAHTGRASGGDKMNLQNLPRGGTLRKAIRAPKGHAVVAVDSSQIEARVVGWLAGQNDLVEDFRNGVDIYSKFATNVYGRPVNRKRKEIDPQTGKEYFPDFVAGFVGKTCILGLGYGMGKDKFKATLKIGQPGLSLDIEIEEAERIVNLYRDTYPNIVELWSAAGKSLDKMVRGYDYEFGTGVTLKCSQDGIILPNGMLVRYPNLTKAENGYTYDTRKGKIKIYGGKIVENVVQALARIVVFDQMAKIDQELRRRDTLEQRSKVVLTVHDEVVAVVPEKDAEQTLAFMSEVMSTPPKWAAGLPVACEGDFALTYGDCK
jgi:DNA polymerase I-like protein with 3'-5' exonuclease and polymerase domains